MYFGYEENNYLKAGSGLLEILTEAEEDCRVGRVAPIEDTFTSLRNILKDKSVGKSCGI